MKSDKKLALQNMSMGLNHYIKKLSIENVYTEGKEYATLVAKIRDRANKIRHAQGANKYLMKEVYVVLQATLDICEEELNAS